MQPPTHDLCLRSKGAPVQAPTHLSGLVPEAVCGCLSRPFAILAGPPGTTGHSIAAASRAVKQSVTIGAPKEAQNYWKRRPEAGAKEAAAQCKATVREQADTTELVEEEEHPFAYPAKKARTQQQREQQAAAEQQQQQAAQEAEEPGLGDDVVMGGVDQEAALAKAEAALEGVEAHSDDVSDDEEWQESDEESE